MEVLVDSSVWIDYFRSGKNANMLDFLIEENLLVINDLILAELIPFLKIKNQRKLIRLLYDVRRLELIIDWNEITNFQYSCIKKGMNGVGIPDLIIAQNARQNYCKIYTLDQHFKKMEQVLNIKLM